MNTQTTRSNYRHVLLRMHTLVLLFLLLRGGMALSQEVTITQEPTDATLTEGDTLKLSVTADGADVLTYQWYFQGAGDTGPGAMQDQTQAELTIANVKTANQGTYIVVVNDTAQSRSAIVKVAKKTIPLQITKQPTPVTVDEGAKLSLEVQAQGEAPLKFEWYVGASADPKPATVVAGQTTSTLTIAASKVSDSGFYIARITDTSGSLDSVVVQVTVKPAQVSTGLLADNGFRPEKDGFSFENYGNDFKPTNLTPFEIRRMFGDRAVATVKGDTIVLTPPAQKWMEKQAAGMSGGHCEGMAVLSLLFYTKKVELTRFAVESATALNVKENPLLQREIGYWFITQYTKPTTTTTVRGTPVEIVDRLIAELKPGATESYTVGVYAPPGVGGGHAVTPYAVENMGNNIYNVLVYDNNHPNKTRRLIVDRTKNTWELGLSINPSETEKPWFGDATTKTFEISPSSPRIVSQDCPFCEETEAQVGTAGLGGAVRFNEIYVDGNGVRLLITDSQGRRYGYESGLFLQEIPNVTHHYSKSGDELWKDAPAPVFYVPTGLQFSLTLDGTVITNRTETSVTLIGHGFDVAIEDIKLDAGQKDTIQFAPDGSGVSYTSSAAESPDITLGFEAPGADFSFTVKGVETDSGATLNVRLDRAKGTLSLSSTGNKQAATYALSVGRFDPDKDQEFFHDGIDLDPKDSAIVEYAKWQGEKSLMHLLIDRNSDGSIDEMVELTDDEDPASSVVAPRLLATISSVNTIKIAWAAVEADFVLESNSVLAPTGWTAVPAADITTVGTTKSVVVTISGGNKFYRLRKN